MCADGGTAPPDALFHVSCDRGKQHPNRHVTGWQGIRQADAYAGHSDLYRHGYKPGPVVSALSWALAHHISPVAFEVVMRIDASFDIKRDINGLDLKAGLKRRSRLSAPLRANLEAWLSFQRALISNHPPVAKAINNLFEKDHWPAFTKVLTDGRLCQTNNAAERSPRGTALSRKGWRFAMSDLGGNRTAFMYCLIVTATMNDTDPQAFFAHVLARMPAVTVSRVPECVT